MSAQELELCEFSGLYSLTCSHCSKKASTITRDGYHYHDEKNGVELQSKRPHVTGFVIWYPYRDQMPFNVGTVHVAGGWSHGHISELINESPRLWMLEFAPSHRRFFDEGWMNLLSTHGIGLQFRRLTSRS